MGAYEVLFTPTRLAPHLWRADPGCSNFERGKQRRDQLHTSAQRAGGINPRISFNRPLTEGRMIRISRMIGRSSSYSRNDHPIKLGDDVANMIARKRIILVHHPGSRNHHPSVSVDLLYG